MPILFIKGVDIKYISRRAGKDVSTTLNKYSHIIDEMEQTESSKVNNMINATFLKAISELTILPDAK